MSWLEREELHALGFSEVGRSVLISDRASFYNCKSISIGDNVRIDDFCIFSAGAGGIALGNHIHIAPYTSLIGAGRITLSDFCNLSSRVAIYSSSDDFSGLTMTSPVIPQEFTGVLTADVFLGSHCIVGCGSVILPGVSLKQGVAVGALSLVTRSCEAFGIYSGIPAKRTGERDRSLLTLERAFLESIADQHPPER